MEYWKMSAEEIAAMSAKGWAALEKVQGRQCERNNRGAELEKVGETAGAIALYEVNAAEGFDGSHPYDRLAILYQKAGRHEDEIRILKRAVDVFEKLVERGGEYGPQKKLDRYRQRLSKIESEDAH